MRTSGNTVISNVTQWGQTAPRRAAFLLAAATANVNVDVPPVNVTVSPIIPGVSTGFELSVLANRTNTEIRNVTVLPSNKAAQRFLLISAIPSTPDVLMKAYSHVIEHTRYVPSRDKTKLYQAFLSGTGTTGSTIYPPPVFINIAPQAPQPAVIQDVIGAMQDDGRWESEHVFIPKRSLAGLLLDRTAPVYQVPAINVTVTPVAPTVTVSNNTIIDVPAVRITVSLNDPVIQQIGAPIINVPPLTISVTPIDPTVSQSNNGVNPSPISINVTPIAPTITIKKVKKVKHVGRVVTQPKLQGATEELDPPFDFSSGLASNETLVSATVTATVYSGVDPNPSAILVGSPQIVKNQVNQLMTGGVVGCLYELLCEVDTSLGQTLQQSTYFYVEPNLP